MDLSDIANATFESLCIGFTGLNLLAILRDKQVRGFSLITSLFFVTWTIWNVFYYASLRQPVSVWGTFAANVQYTNYIFLVFYYVWLERNNQQEVRMWRLFGQSMTLAVYLALGLLLARMGFTYHAGSAWPDALNGFFETGGGIFSLLNCKAILRDQELKGASLIAFCFYVLWGLWNLYYYPHLGQYLSWYGGILIVLVNSWYIYLILYFRVQKVRVSIKPVMD
ncbi:MAG TPA: hypothetical protein VMU13_00835 [Candidatus Paceibacterota bacterium]|nr:hypothetical protein [Candidatus Paceibacterota bacterium]